jgi:hypothetical protein
MSWFLHHDPKTVVGSLIHFLSSHGDIPGAIPGTYVATRLVRLAVGPLSSHFSASFIARLALYHIVPISLLTQLSTQNVFLQHRFTSSERAIILLACAPHSNPELDLLSLKRKKLRPNEYCWLCYRNRRSSRLPAA